MLENDVSRVSATPQVVCNWSRKVHAGGLSGDQRLDVGGASREQIWAPRLDHECVGFSRSANYEEV
jgi:hypothetical protein